MTRTLFMLLILVAGFAQPLQGAVNAYLASRGATFIWATAISACVTAFTLALLAIFVFRVPPPALRLIVSMPTAAVAGGIIGALLLASITAATPRLGATVTHLIFIAGITVGSVLLDYFAVLGLPHQDITIPRLLGIGLIVSGVAVIRLL